MYVLCALLCVAVLFSSAHSIRLSQSLAGCEHVVPLLHSRMQVYLSVSSLASTSKDGLITQRLIEMNWYGTYAKPGDWVGLYTHDPTLNPTDPLEMVAADRYPGVYRTSVTFARPILPGPNYQGLFRRPKEKCLGYWIGYIHRGEAISINCLKQEPNWMEEHKHVLENMTLLTVMLPGTHNAGSYGAYIGVESENTVTKYGIYQDEDIWNQLWYGIRFLDVRIGYYPDSAEKFWFTNGFTRWNPLSVGVSHVKQFLNYTNEIVFFDVHQFGVGFEGNETKKHNELMEYLETQLGFWMAPRRERDDVRLKEFWDSGQRLIVSYAHPLQKNHPKIWPEVFHEKGNVRSREKLYTHLSRSMKRALTTTRRWSAMAQLTAPAVSLINNDLGSLRTMADSINREVTYWFRHLWWAVANIVSVDFFLGTGMVNVCIEANIRRKRCEDVYRKMTTTTPPIHIMHEEQTQPTRKWPIWQGPR